MPAPGALRNRTAHASGARVIVSTIATNWKDCAPFASMHREGLTPDHIIAELPDLEPEDIREVLRYAAEAVRKRELPLLPQRS